MNDIRTAFQVLLIVFLAQSSALAGGFEHFITVRNGNLMEGDRIFRFISFNVPNLHCIEDNMVFTEENPWRLPNTYEIEDALESVQQMGGQVVRPYAVTVRREDDLPDTPRYVEGPGEFNERAFRTLDTLLATAAKYNIRVIIPFVDNWSWMGGRAEYAGFRGEEPDAFWTDDQILNDFKETVKYIINRKNTVTGQLYKNDKTILGWETGNELHSPPDWTREMTQYIKSLDTNHLVIDGYHSSTVRDASLRDPNTDILTTHHYESDPREMVEHVRANVKKIDGEKPYFLGEFGFITTSAARHVLDTVIDNDVSGALIWSLRFHNRDGGFYWHSEPWGGDFYKAYHWPGFPSGALYDEASLMELMRRKAFEIQGKPVPEHTAPAAPRLLPINNVAEISWQGSAGAAGYTVQRSISSDGPWRTLADNVSDAAVQYRPLYNDEMVEPGEEYFYRVLAHNIAGTSPPSNVRGPVRVHRHTLVDEMRAFGTLYWKTGNLTLESDSARNYKEDIHRIAGATGDTMEYRVTGPIRSFTLYTFTRTASTSLRFSLSGDGETYRPLPVQSTSYFSGEADYNYWKPIRFSVDSMPMAAQYLRIMFRDITQLSRIEITYGE